MGSLISSILKHNPITEILYNQYLSWRTSSVESYIFVACTGRSGSLSMTEIFKAVDGCASFHEPPPKMLSIPRYDSNKDIYHDRQFKKLKRVYVKRAAIGSRYYFESNHLFIKNMITPAINCFQQKLKIIHLVRDPVSVARSLYNLNDIPGETEISDYYYLNPRSADNILDIRKMIYGNREFSHNFYKCLWYFYEIEARIEEMKKLHPNHFIFRIKTENLNDVDVLSDMFKALNIPVNSGMLKEVVGIRRNKRKSEKVSNIEIDECIAMNEKMINYLEKEYGAS